MRFDAIPSSLQDLRRWCVWRFEFRNENKTKVPYQTNKGRLLGRAKTDTPSTWATFAECLPAVDRHSDVGLGIMLGDGLIGFDFDNIRLGENAWQPKAVEWLKRINGYAECSPSGTGIKTLCFAMLPDGFLTETPTGRNLKGIPENGCAVEIYRRRRFFTLTCNRLQGLHSPHVKQSDVNAVCEEILTAYFANRPQPTSPRRATPLKKTLLSDAAIIEKIKGSRQATKFENLFNGNIGAYDSASEADLALTSILMFWCGNDTAQVERIFADSPLAKREKWDRQDYRERTLAKAAASDVYTQLTSLNKKRLGGNVFKRL